MNILCCRHALIIFCALVFLVGKATMNVDDEVTVFVGTYTDKDTKSEGIYGFRLKFNADGSEFTSNLIGTTKIVNPSFLTVTNNKKYLLVVSETADQSESKIHSFQILPGGKLKAISSTSSLGTYTCYVSVNSDDKFAYVANYFGGIAAAFSIDGDAKLTLKNSITFNDSVKVHQRQEVPHVHMIRPSPDGRFVYISDLGNDHIVKLPFDSAQGFSTGSKTEFKTPPGAGPRHFDFHPSGNYLYLSCELSNTVSVFHVKSKDSGDLELIQTLSSLPHGVNESMIAEIRVHPSGRFVYVSNRGPDTVTLFNVEDDGAKLVVKDFYSTRGIFPRNFDLTDKVMIVGNQDSSSLAVFKIDQKDGKLIPIGDTIQCPSPVRVKIL